MRISNGRMHLLIDIALSTLPLCSENVNCRRMRCSIFWGHLIISTGDILDFRFLTDRTDCWEFNRCLIFMLDLIEYPASIYLELEINFISMSNR